MDTYYFFPLNSQILAWNPHAYITEFTDLLPAFLSPTTAIEVRTLRFSHPPTYKIIKGTLLTLIAYDNI